MLLPEIHYTPPGDLMTPQEVATMLRIGRSALYEWLARRELGYYKLGRVIRLRRSDVEAFLQRNLVSQAPSEKKSSNALYPMI